jgi:hypothetical protein
VRRKIAAGAIAGLFLLAGCSKTEAVEDKVQDLVEKNVPGATDVKVDCPNDVKAEKGEKFDCKLNYTRDGEQVSSTGHVEFTADNEFTVTEET